MTPSAGAAARTPLHRLRESPIWIAVILATLTIFGPLSMDLYLPVLPSLAADLATTTSAAQLTMTTCLLGLALGQVIAGPLSDRYGRRVVLLSGLVVYTVASLACAFSDSITLLVVLRLVQGAAGGFGLVIAQACGRDLYEGPRLNRYNGRIVVLSGLAAIVAPVIGGVLAAHVAWQGFFVLLAAFGLVITLAVAVSFRETLPVERRVTGGAGHTLAHLAVLARDRRFVGATAASSLTSATYFAYLAAAPFVLQDLFGLSPAQYALVIGVNAAGFAAFGFTAGRAAERWGERVVFATGIALVIAGATVLAATASAPPPLAVMVGAFLLIAAGAAAVSPPSTTMALTDYPAFAGTASSVLGLSRFVAGAAAAPLVGLAGPLSTTPLAAVALATGLTSAVVFALLLVRGRAPHPSAGSR